MMRLPLHSSEIWTATATKTVYLKANAGTPPTPAPMNCRSSVCRPRPRHIPHHGDYEANGPAVALDPTGFTVTDVDNVNFARGVLTFKITSNATNFDRLEIINSGTGTNQIGLHVYKITYGGVVIGVIQGSSTDKTVFLNGKRDSRRCPGTPPQHHLPDRDRHTEHRTPLGPDSVERRDRVP